MNAAIFPCWTTALVAVAAQAQVSEFVHPGGAFSLRPPAGWNVRAHVDTRGLPFHLFTPDDAGDPTGCRRGMWVYTVPIPTDDDLSAADLAYLTSSLFAADEPELRIDADRRTAGRLGGLKSVAALPVGGRRGKAGEWKGEVLIGVQEDNFLVVHYGAVPAEWEAVRTGAQTALAGLVAPVKAVPAHFAPKVKDTQRLRDISEHMMKCTPRINVFGQAPHGTQVVGSGSGFLIHPAGYVVTNRHVVARGVDQKSGRVYREAYDPVQVVWDQSTGIPPATADVVGVSAQHDCSLLKIRSAKQDWPFVPLSDIADVRNGDKIAVIGWPAGEDFDAKNVTFVEGTLASIIRDRRGRPVLLRASAQTTGGNSGGPVYNLDTGGIIGIHAWGLRAGDESRAIKFGGSVPVHRLLWEFPRVAAAGASPVLSLDERRALIAYYFLQERYAAAMMEIGAALADHPRDGVVNAYAFRLYRIWKDKKRAEPHLHAALDRKESEALVCAFAGRSSLESRDFDDAVNWGRRVVELNGRDPEGHIILCRTALEKGELDAAKAHAERASKAADGLCAEAEMLRGVVGLEEWMRSNNIFRLTGRERMPDFTATMVKRHLDKSIALKPYRNSVAHAYKALLLTVAGDMKAAATARFAALRSAPGDTAFGNLRYVDLISNIRDPETLLAVAQFDLMDGRPSEARFLCYLCVLECGPGGRAFYIWGSASLDRAAALFKEGRAKEGEEMRVEAMELLRLAVASEPKAPWAQAARSLLVVAEGPVEPALAGTWVTTGRDNAGQYRLVYEIAGNGNYRVLQQYAGAAPRQVAGRLEARDGKMRFVNSDNTVTQSTYRFVNRNEIKVVFGNVEYTWRRAEQ